MKRGRVSGKVALVTGGAMGIGRANSCLLAQEGASVVVTDIEATAGEHVAREIQHQGGQAIFLTLDVANEENWKSVVEKAIETYGKIHILVNNAGIGVLKALDETTTEEWDHVMDVNAKGVFFGCKYVLPAMKRPGVARLSTPLLSGASWVHRGRLLMSLRKGR